MSAISLGPALRVFYLDRNKTGSPTLLLLHGLGATQESWQFQIPAFEQAGFRVLAPDTRGFGRSTYPGGGFSIPDLAADCAMLLDKLQAAPAHLVGISMGGTIALQLATDFPDYVCSLVLANTFSALRPGSISGWVYFLLRFLLVHSLGIHVQAQAVSRRVFPDPEKEVYRRALIDQIKQANPQAYRAAMRALASFNHTHRLSEIQKPTLVLTGSRDSTIKHSTQRILVERIPMASQIVIQGAGHAVSIDQPDIFNQNVIDFIKANNK